MATIIDLMFQFLKFCKSRIDGVQFPKIYNKFGWFKSIISVDLTWIIVIAVFKGIPDEPGRLCDGETSKFNN